MLMQLYLLKLELLVWTASALSFSEPQKILNELIAAYSEKQRAYHTVQHLYECLSLIETIQSELNDPYAVALALWFHDVVYEPQALDNELKSAELFEQLMAQDLQLDTMQKIKRWILATQSMHQPMKQICNFVRYRFSYFGSNTWTFYPVWTANSAGVFLGWSRSIFN